jgi:hypothetical protein
MNKIPANIPVCPYAIPVSAALIQASPIPDPLGPFADASHAGVAPVGHSRLLSGRGGGYG